MYYRGVPNLSGLRQGLVEGQKPGLGRGSDRVWSRSKCAVPYLTGILPVSYRYLTGISRSRVRDSVECDACLPGLGQDARPTKQARLELGSFWRSAASTSGESSGAASSNARHVPVPGLPVPVHGRNSWVCPTVFGQGSDRVW